MILLPCPPLGKDVAWSPFDREAALQRAMTTLPESIYSKSSELSTAGHL
jgi:hypothetical protein